MRSTSITNHTIARSSVHRLRLGPVDGLICATYACLGAMWSRATQAPAQTAQSAQTVEVAAEVATCIFAFPATHQIQIIPPLPSCAPDGLASLGLVEPRLLVTELGGVRTKL